MKLFLTLLLATCALAAPQWPGAGSSGSGPPAGVGGPPKAGGWSPTASDSESERARWPFFKVAMTVTVTVTVTYSPANRKFVLKV